MAAPPDPPPPPPPVHQTTHIHVHPMPYPVPTTAPSPGLLTFLNVVNTITQLLIGAVVLGVLMFVGRFSASAYKTHIIMCVLGYMLLMSEAVLSLNPHVGWANSLDLITRKRTHGVLQVIGSLLAIIGSIVRMADIEDNFVTAHGILGIVAMILTLISLLGGAANYMSQTKPTINPKVLKLLHSCLGIVTLVVAYICLCVALTSNYFRLWNGTVNSNILVGAAVFALFGILCSAFENFRRNMSNK